MSTLTKRGLVRRNVRLSFPGLCPDDGPTSHEGPTTRDFHAPFGVGLDDRHLSTVDADGVALAAIQGLNQKMEEQRAELEQKAREMMELKQRLAALEQLVLKLTTNAKRE